MYSATMQRTPLVITAGGLTAGPVHATFRDGDSESLLHNYLVLVRRLRGQQREPSITLRNADISAIAAHLGASEDRVLDDLLDRMGATRAQRKALLAMFAVGALSIVATGSVALEFTPAGALGEGSSDAPPVVEAVVPSAVVAMQEVAVVDAPALSESVAAESLASEPVAASEPVVAESVPQAELAIATGGDDWEYALSLHQLAHALATQPPAEASVSSSAAGDGAAVDSAAPGSEGVGVADDGSVVAVAESPVPPTEGVGVADDGSVVAVAEPPVPPVPPTEGVGIADDGSVVAVAEPPLP